MTNIAVGLGGAFITAYAALFATAASSDGGRGKLLYENQCSACHESTMHVRGNHKAKSLAEIRAEVLRWSANQKLNWGPAEIDDVTDYLDENFYHYGQTRD